MIEKLKQIEDRFLLAAILLIFGIAFAVTKEPKLGDMVYILFGAFCTILIKRTENVVNFNGGDAQTVKTIAAEFASKQ